MGVKTFWIEPTGRYLRSLRRYRSGGDEKCPGPMGYHDASAPLDIVEEWETDRVSGDLWPHDDPRWPATCVGCGRVFTDDDRWQLSVDREYRDIVSRETTSLRAAGPGAMWDADWWPWKGQDGRSIAVKLPNGHEWGIDLVASNCTMRDDNAAAAPDRKHWCWIRHGEPPELTVDKNGPTCAAGAGSIQSGDYHGFLANGEFVP